MRSSRIIEYGKEIVLNMNTSSKIEMKILDDLYSSDNSSITRSYASYYETTT